MRDVKVVLIEFLCQVPIAHFNNVVFQTLKKSAVATTVEDAAPPLFHLVLPLGIPTS